MPMLPALVTISYQRDMHRVQTYKANSLNDLSAFMGKNETFTQKQRSSKWVDPSMRVILGAVMDFLNDIGLDASLRNTVKLN